MAFKRKPKRKRKNNNLEDCALPENRTPLEEKPTTEGQTLQEAAPCSEEQPCAQAAPCSEEQPCAQAAPCSEAQPCAEAEPDIDEEEEKKTRFNTIWAPCDVKRALNCGMFSPQTFAWIIDEKYNHGSTFEDIIGRLADQGLKIDKVTFNENVHRVLDRLRLGCQPLFRDRIRLGTHEAVDETFMLVAVKTKVEKDGKMVEVTEYKIRYMWCFYDYINQNVYYVYEDGSRAQDVLKNTFFSPDCDKATLMLKTLISDGYSAYNLFDNPKEGNPFMDANGNPLVLHCGDWVHARRRIVHMIVESQEEALTLINMVRELFVIEAFAKNAKLTPERIKEIRAKYAIPVINDIFQKVEEYSKDAALMGRQYTANAISYILKQRTRLTNYTKDGKALISSNCVERLMKPVKKILKTCMFIGSENAARNFAFTLSLMMTAKKHNIKFYDYMVDLLNGLQNAPELKKGEEEEYEKAISTMADPYMPWHYVKVR